MIQSCKSSVSHAYALIGKGDDEGARSVSERLSRCAVRGNCPYTRECVRTVEMLKEDLSGDSNGYQILSPAFGAPALGNAVATHPASSKAQLSKVQLSQTQGASPRPAVAGGEVYRSVKGL